ncbi:hypothetical protein [Methylohalobius crimeensis]|uniref:hypothetical protein n=1 Tax=Methylohalobius crimeensis TaxID=244365 RepID=UPI0003B3431F|nr:hypothetical protein [Methylohalobius crimeensis]
MTTAENMLAQYLAAEADLLKGKTIIFNGKHTTREDLDQIRKGRREWEKRVEAEKARASGVPTVGGLRYSLARLDGE